MQFKVPQFIDIEDKVFGPLTFKQFAYLAGGLGFGYLSFKMLPIIISIFLGPVLVAFGVALAFMKYNDKPFIHVVESFVKFYSHSRLYLWHKEAPKSTDTVKMTKAPVTKSARNALPQSNLSTLSLNLDIIGSKK
jgi:hypothetical protein